MKQQQTPSAEYFAANQRKMLRALTRGRHPRSFPRVSELWHHALATSKRLDAIRAGHNIWNVLEGSAGEEEETDSNNSLASQTAHPYSFATSPAVQPGGAAAGTGTGTGPDASLTRIDFTVNGLHIDIRNKIQLHYGMLAVLMDDKQDIVCVSQAGEPFVKHVSHILPTDKTLFKLIDLREVNNPHQIKFGDPVWLQIVDPQLGSSASLNWNMATTLGPKLFALNEMETEHLNPDWVGDGYRHSLLSSIAQDHAPPPSPRGGHLPSINNTSSASTISDDGAGMLNAGQKRRSPHANSLVGDGDADESDDDVDAGDAEGDGGQSKAKAQGKSALRSSKASVLKTDTGTSTNSSSSGSGGSGGGGGGGGGSPSARTSGANLQDPEATIVGGTQAVLMGAMAVATAKKNDRDLAMLHGVSSTTGKLISREAMALGQLSFVSASRTTVPELQMGEPVPTNTPILLSQNTYCLASSAGADYKRWPLTSHDIAPNKDLSSLDSPARNHGAASRSHAPIKSGHPNAPADDEPHSSRTHTSTRTNPSRSSRRDAHAPSSGDNASSNVCPLVTRKIVHKTSPTYPYAVDRRCVFKVCIVDNVADTSELSTQERNAQKLIVRAKDVLRRSEMLRMGAKSYPLSDDGDAAPITSGEKFSKNLRRNVSVKLLAREREILQPRRDKEKVIKEHFESFCQDWDHGDDVSIAGSSVAKSRRSKVHSLDDRSRASLGVSVMLDDDESQGPSLSQGQGQGQLPQGLEQPSFASDMSPQTHGFHRERQPLPHDHYDAYRRNTQALLDASERSRVLKPYHYHDYPNYYKHVPPSTANPHPSVVEPERLNYLDKNLSVGQAVVSIRQSLENIASRVEQGLMIERALNEVKANKPTAAGQSHGHSRHHHGHSHGHSHGHTQAQSLSQSQNQNQNQNQNHHAAKRPPPANAGLLEKLGRQDAHIVCYLDHAERVALESRVKSAMTNINLEAGRG